MTAPIRVLMITSDWPDHASWGGTATFISRQVDFLRAAGVDVDVFRFRGVGNPLRYASAWLGVQRRFPFPALGVRDLPHLLQRGLGVPMLGLQCQFEFLVELPPLAHQALA